MYQSICDSSSPCNHNQHINETFNHSTISTMDIKQERTNYVNINTACDPVHSNFVITKLPSDYALEQVKVEPIYDSRTEEDPLVDMANLYGSQAPTNTTILKEEIIIKCEPDLDIDFFENTKTTTANRDKEESAKSINRHISNFTESKMESGNGVVITDKNQPASKRRKRNHKNWRKEKTFALEGEALVAVKDEQTWSRDTTNKTEKGNKIIYRCRNFKSKGEQCAAGVYLLYSRDDATVTLYRSANKHTCGIIIEPKSGHMTEEYFDDPPVNETSIGTWDRKFKRKEDIDLAATYDLDLKIVLKKYETTPILSLSDQMTICKSIVKCYLYENHDRKFGIQDFKRISKVIAQRFPGELEETYYTKEKKKRARGKLYDQFQHFRGLLISVGLATKRRKVNRDTGRESDEESGSETYVDGNKIIS